MKIAIAALVPLALLPSVYSWGSQGHEIVATVAQIYLHPSAHRHLCDVLYPESGSLRAPSDPSGLPCHIADVASWADQVRNQSKYAYTKTLHFVSAVDDFPSRTCVFPGPKGWERPNNIISAIRDMTDTLVNHTEGRETYRPAEEALKFLIHFLGDVHQPLHLSGREVGGNLVNVTFGGKLTRLHKLWDDFLIPQKINELSENYTRPLPPGSAPADLELHLQGKSYDPYIRRLVYEGLSLTGRFPLENQVEWLSCPKIQDPSSPQIALGTHNPPPPGDWDDEVLCPYVWAKTTQRLNCDFPTWPRELDEYSPGDSKTMGKYPLLELDTPEYSGRIREEWIVEKLLAQGGLRLAGILNGIFADDEGEIVPHLRL